MLVLGFESSCDETGVAMVQTQNQGVPTLLAHALHSQIDMHQAYGGVVPELASRQHLRDICGVVERAMAQFKQSGSYEVNDAHHKEFVDPKPGDKPGIFPFVCRSVRNSLSAPG